MWCLFHLECHLMVSRSPISLSTLNLMSFFQMKVAKETMATRSTIKIQNWRNDISSAMGRAWLLKMYLTLSLANLERTNAIQVKYKKSKSCAHFSVLKPMQNPWYNLTFNTTKIAIWVRLSRSCLLTRQGKVLDEVAWFVILSEAKTDRSGGIW